MANTIHFLHRKCVINLWFSSFFFFQNGCTNLLIFKMFLLLRNLQIFYVGWLFSIVIDFLMYKNSENIITIISGQNLIKDYCVLQYTTNTERSHKHVSKGTSLTWKHKCMLFVMVVVITVLIAVGTVIYILVNKESEKGLFA